MELNHNTYEAVFRFSPKNFFLVYSKDDRFFDDSFVWTLNYKIDRSFKGKDPDVGLPIIYLEVEEANKLKEYFDMYI